MINAKTKKILPVLLVTFSLICLQNSHAELSQDSKDAIKIARALTVLTKFGFAIAANAQELKENELAALKLETTYLCLDVADTTLKMLEDFERVSLIEEGIGIYHLIKIFQNIHAINFKKSAEQKKNASKSKNNTKKDKKQKELAKKIIYSIIKYSVLAAEAGNSIAFNSSDEDEKIVSSNISGFTKLLFDLIDNATPQVRSKALLVLAPVALLASLSIAKDQQENRKKMRKEAADKKRKEEEKQAEKELRKERERQEKEEAERKQKQKEQEENERKEREQKIWDSLSEEEKKQEQDRRKRKEKQEENERRFDNNFRTNQRRKKEKFWENIKEKWEKLKREKGQKRFSNFSYYNREFENQFGFRDSFNSFNNPFSYQNPLNSLRSPSDLYQNSFDSYQDPFDDLNPEFYLDYPLFKIGSNYLSDEENKVFWDNVKEQWNNFKEQQANDELRYREQRMELEEAYQRKENEIKKIEKINKLTSYNKDQVEICAICLESFHPGDRISILSCDGHHVYHQNCIITWLNSDPKVSCPCCRHENVTAENIILNKNE